MDENKIIINNRLGQMLFQALLAKYDAQLMEYQANLSVYFECPVGVGEHPNLLAEADKFVTLIAEVEGKAYALKSRFAQYVAPAAVAPAPEEPVDGPINS